MMSCVLYPPIPQETASQFVSRHLDTSWFLSLLIGIGCPCIS